MSSERDHGDEHVDMNGNIIPNAMLMPDGSQSWTAWRDEAYRLMDEVDKLRFRVESLERNNKVLQAWIDGNNWKKGTAN